MLVQTLESGEIEIAHHATELVLRSDALFVRRRFIHGLLFVSSGRFTLQASSSGVWDRCFRDRRYAGIILRSDKRCKVAEEVTGPSAFSSLLSLRIVLEASLY